MRSNTLLRLGIAFAQRGCVLSGLISAACSSKSSQVTKVIEADGGGAAPSTSGAAGSGGAGQGGERGGNGGDAGEGAAGEAGSGEAGATGAGGAPCTDVAAPDIFSVPACGETPGTTAGAYSGIVTLTLSGVVQFGQYDLMDAFYGMHIDTPSVTNGDCPDCLRYNRASEGGCVCGVECASTSHRFADLLTTPYPEFNPTHEYTVQIDLGSAPAEPFNFGIQDCGCTDNSGALTLTVTAPEEGCPP